MHKFPYVDLSGSLIEGTVDVGTVQTFWRKQLGNKIKINALNLRQIQTRVIQPFLSYSVCCVSPLWGTLHGVWWLQTPLSAPEASPHSLGGKVALLVCRPIADGKMTADGRQDNVKLAWQPCKILTKDKFFLHLDQVTQLRIHIQTNQDWLCQPWKSKKSF